MKRELHEIKFIDVLKPISNAIILHYDDSNFVELIKEYIITSYSQIYKYNIEFMNLLILNKNLTLTFIFNDIDNEPCYYIDIVINKESNKLLEVKLNDEDYTEIVVDLILDKTNINLN